MAALAGVDFGLGHFVDPVRLVAVVIVVVVLRLRAVEDAQVLARADARGGDAIPVFRSSHGRVLGPGGAKSGRDRAQREDEGEQTMRGIGRVLRRAEDTRRRAECAFELEKNERLW